MIETELSRIETELAALGPIDRSIEAVRMRPSIDWTATPGAINTRLKELWSRIDLGLDMRPIRAQWYLSLAEHEAREDAQTAIIRRGW
jgi:hypothetical protein